MIYAYCRISTPKQSMERQIRNILRLYPNATIFQEVYTGTKVDGRRKWEQLLHIVQPGDTIIFDSVSRMSRNAEEGFSAYQQLYEQGVDLVFLKEPHINTQTYKQALSNHVKLTGDKVDYILEGVNKYLMALAKEQIRLAFAQAEKEVSDLHQRTREGIETARLNGKQIGQPKGATLITQKSLTAKETILRHSRDFGGTLSDRECISLLHISRNTYYKYKAELKETG